MEQVLHLTNHANPVTPPLGSAMPSSGYVYLQQGILKVAYDAKNSSEVAGVQYYLGKTLAASGIAPSGTVNNNGAVVLGTALSITYSSGLYLYFPAGALFSGSAAGSYWTVMSSTTAGIVYNNLRTNIPTPPTTLLPIVATGPGAYTGSLATVSLADFILAGNSLGLNGSVKSYMLLTANTTAGNKQLRTRLGTTALLVQTATTVGFYSLITSFRNMNSKSSQLCHYNNQGDAGTGGTITRSTIDTSVDQIYNAAGTLAVATDWLILESAEVAAAPY